MKLREAANGDFPWNSKPAKLRRLEQNGPKNLRLDSVEVLPTKSTPRTSWVKAAMLRFDPDHAAKQRFSKMLIEKPLPALPVEDPVETCKAPTVPTEAPTFSRVEQRPPTTAPVEPPGLKLDNKRDSKLDAETLVLPEDIMDEVDDHDEPAAFGKYIIFGNNGGSDDNKGTLRVVDASIDTGRKRRTICPDSELADKVKSILHAQQEFQKAEASLALKERMHLAFAQQLRTQIAQFERGLQDGQLASSATQLNGCEKVMGALYGEASIQHAKLVSLNLSLADTEARRAQVSSLLEQKAEELRDHQSIVNAYLETAFEAANLPEQPAFLPLTPAHDLDLGFEYRAVCERLGVEAES